MDFVTLMDVLGKLVATGLGWALALGLGGGLLQAVRAARLPITRGFEGRVSSFASPEPSSSTRFSAIVDSSNTRRIDLCARRCDNFRRSLAGGGMFCRALLACAVLLGGCVSSQPTPAPDQPFWREGAFSPSARFEMAKRSTPELIAFLRRMPKGADLHNHVGGATFADYLIESAVANGKRFDRVASHFTDETGEHTVGMDEFLVNPALIAQFRNAMSVRGWQAEGGSGHDHFFSVFQHIGTAGRSAGAMLAEVLARNHYQNVQYLELMATTAPPGVVQRFQGAFAGLDLDNLESSYAPFADLVDDPGILRAFTDAVDAWEAEADALLQNEHGLNFEDVPMVRYIPQLDRAGSVDRFFIATVLFMTAIRADERIVALTMVAPEDLPTARTQFDAQMRILDFLWQKLGRPHVTLHAGELSLRESPVEPMWNRIRRSIDEGHAQRIGHGASVAWERDIVGLLEQMAQQDVMVEVIPSSAEVILGLAGKDHPLLLYQSAGVPVCIATDDEAVNRSNLTMEYVKAVQHYDFDYATLKAMVGDCLAHAFLDPAAKRTQQQALSAAFDVFEASLASGYREP